MQSDKIVIVSKRCMNSDGDVISFYFNGVVISFVMGIRKRSKTEVSKKCLWQTNFTLICEMNLKKHFDVCMVAFPCYLERLNKYIVKYNMTALLTQMLNKIFFFLRKNPELTHKSITDSSPFWQWNSHLPAVG